ncbi:MAG: ATP-binding cassette domain-containing protein [Desulfobulbaceae bacterium]|nr:ATP-binding cassette domain-containing protein [Desulfobulbaceae bacterium]
MIRVQGLSAPGLHIDRFTAKPEEAWCLVGANTSGVALLCDVIAGEKIDFHAELLQVPAEIGVLSFKRQQAIFEAELRKDDTDFLNRIDGGTPARNFLSNPEAHRELIELFALNQVLDRGYRQLSSGQARKLCLLQLITQGASLLVLENPYEGLDRASCRELDRVLAQLHQQGVGILIFVNNTGDIPLWCSHLAAIQEGRMTLQGPIDEVLPAVQRLLWQQPPQFRIPVEELRRERPTDGQDDSGPNLLTLTRGFARYGEVEVFNNLDLTVDQGDHTLITGPNGCGKSTLLQIITGDHPLCYVNQLVLFGKRRGSGESVWEVKRQMGIVSHDLHRNHRVAGSALAIVVSGLYDSIGLYARPTTGQQQLAHKWLQRLGLADKAGVAFRRLSYGEQRLILLARALIKVPRLLILDEPTQGIDERNRLELLDFLTVIASDNLCTILYVSHRPDEYRDFFTQQIRFG